ncbi:hypothetical protein D3C75_878450 [compost metagenome]
MKKRYLGRGFRSESFKLLPKKLKTKLYDLIENQIERGLEMDHAQFFEMYQLEPGRICVIHSQCYPDREEIHVFDGYSLPFNATDFFIMNRRICEKRPRVVDIFKSE